MFITFKNSQQFLIKMVLLKSLRLGAGGIVTGINYHMKHLLNNNQYPTFLIYQLTDNCNSRCLMCNIWKKKPAGELTKDEIKNIYKKKSFSRLRWVNLTGGEPFIRKDIVDIVKIISRLPEFEGVAIPSNGILTKKIVNDTNKILDFLPKEKFLSITLSIDGFEKTHDEIRGVPGAYKKVVKTLEELTMLMKKHPNFNVGVQPTITKKNLPEIDKFYRFMKKKTSSIGFAIMLTSEGYYDNIDSDVALTKQDKKWIERFLKRIIKEDPQYGFYYSKLIDMFQTGKRGFGCLAGYITMYMDSFGDISPCPVLSSDKRYLFGNIKKDNVWFSKKSKVIKKNLKNEEICRKCTMMCDFINVAKVEFFEHASFMMLHPNILINLFKKIRKEKNPYF